MKATTTTEKFWTDENGVRIPVKRITAAEKLRERHIAQLVKKAQDVNKRLVALKEDIRVAVDEMEAQGLEEMGVSTRTGKGNLTLYNFDRSAYVERAVSEPMRFDDLTIAAARTKLNEFLEEAIESKFDFAKEMILTAFETRNGKLDPKKVTPLTRYVDKVNHPLFTAACELIQKAIRRPDSKTYYRVLIRPDGGDGKHESIELNFSNI